MDETVKAVGGQELLQALRRELAPYGRPDLRKAIWQLLNSFGPFFALWVFMYAMVRHGYPYWAIFPLILLATLFLVRIFVLFHDCAHGSFFASGRANRGLGYLIGIMAFTPLESWAHAHNIHHGTYANLDHRGMGDIWTLTVDEYLAAPGFEQLRYRLTRNPLILFGIGSTFMFLVVQRFPYRHDGKAERNSVMVTNLGVLLVLWMVHLTIGLRTYLLLYLPMVFFATSIGVWLFYVQHQFEGVYWTRQTDWDPMRAALEGSSCYRLPRVLQWFTGNIGLHNIHHVLPRIPNYHLQSGYDATPFFHTIKPLTLRGSLKSLHLNLWDERHRELVSFQSLRKSSRQERTRHHIQPGQGLPTRTA